jgi:Kef-type K+ transport system membrane component KefB
MHTVTAHDTLLYLLIDVAIIIVAARIMGSLARRLNQPAVIGEVVAGIVLGPTLLGRIDPSLPGDIFPAHVPLRSIADLGLVFFMFLVGLELDPGLLRRNGVRPAVISLSGVVVPAVSGVLLGLLLFDVNLGGTFLEDTERPDRTAFALFIGAAMCITAFPVLARILVETGLYRTGVGLLTLCAAAVDDVIAWILLAAVVGLVQTGSPLEAGRALILTAVFVVFMLVVGRRLLGLIGKSHAATGHLTINHVALILAGVLVAAFVTERIGIHSIFGAFIFGALMPKPSALVRELSERIEDFTVAVMLPVFFLVTGLRTDLFTLKEPELLGWLLAIIAVAIGGKFIGCGLAARLTGSNATESLVVGSLMNTRGLTELVILTIGLNLGVLSDRTFAMMVIMALSTTIMAAPIIDRLMPRRVILAEIARADQLAPAAGRALVAVADMQLASAHADLAVRLLKDRRPAELILVRLTPTSRAPELRSGLADEAGEAASWEDSVRRLAEHAAGAGVAVRSLSFFSDAIADDLTNLAVEQDCDFIVAPWLQRPGGESNAAVLARLLRLAPARILVAVNMAPADQAPDPRQVVALLGRGSSDEAAARTALMLAGGGTAVRLLGYAGQESGRNAAEASRQLALMADSLRGESGLWVTAEYHLQGALDAAIESAAGGMLVVALPEGAAAQEEELMRAIAGAGVPALLVREALPEAATARTRPADWPFIMPRHERPEDMPWVQPLAVAHLQKLDPWGEILETRAIEDGLSIGRAAENDLVIGNDRLVSRSHARVTRRGDDYVLADHSTNGTMVWRGERWLAVEHEQQTLQDGDFIVVGGNVFRFESGGKAALDEHGQIAAHN